MAIKEILLPLVGEPSAAAIAAIDKCVAVAGAIGAQVCAIAVENDILVRPKVTSSADLGNTAKAETVRSISNAKSLLKAFGAATVRFGVCNEQRLQLGAVDIPVKFGASARFKDLSIVPVKPDDGQSEELVERLLFESGRPILICPQEFAAELEVAFDHVVIAWDDTAPAARAVGDAMPFLRAAANVHVITATDKRTPAELESGAALVSHLAEHGIKATFETVKIDGCSVGKVLEAYVTASAIDLLVMGAYHHSRLNETVWGGATKTVIARPPCWVMMSR
jgi:nucleotide-binding universal stress UspA family protein